VMNTFIMVYICTYMYNVPTFVLYFILNLIIDFSQRGHLLLYIVSMMSWQHKKNVSNYEERRLN